MLPGVPGSVGLLLPLEVCVLVLADWLELLLLLDRRERPGGRLTGECTVWLCGDDRPLTAAVLGLLVCAADGCLLCLTSHGLQPAQQALPLLLTR